MKIHPSRLRATRLAAAEALIEEGLRGTGWTAEMLRRVADEMDFRVRFPARFGNAAGAGTVDIHIDETRDGIHVRVEPRHLDSLSPDEAIDAADRIRAVAQIARKVEAAMEEAAR